MRGHWRDEQQLLELDARLARAAQAAVRGPFADAADERVIATALAPRIAGALAALNREQREVLLLHAWADLSHEEIAAALGIARARPGRGCRGPARRCAPSSASSTSTCGHSRRQTMPDEIDLLRGVPGGHARAGRRRLGAARAAVALAEGAATPEPRSRRTAATRDRDPPGPPGQPSPPPWSSSSGSPPGVLAGGPARAADA